MSISVLLFQNLDLGIASADEKLHLATLCLARVNINADVYAKFYQNIPKGSKDKANFTFFRS